MKDQTEIERDLPMELQIDPPPQVTDDGADQILHQIRARRTKDLQEDPPTSERLFYIGCNGVTFDQLDEQLVYIYTWMHEVGGVFDVRVNGTIGMPDDWRDAVLALNNQPLTDEQCWDLNTRIFGDAHFMKWDKRTRWSSVIGTYEDFVKQLEDDLAEYEGCRRQLVYEFLRMNDEKHQRKE